MNLTCFTEHLIMKKGVALLARFTVKQRLIVFAGAGLGVLVIMSGLLIFSNTVLEGAVRLREKALEVDANLFKRQAQARLFIRLHDVSSGEQYKILRRSGSAAVDWVAGNSGLTAKEAHGFVDENKSLDASFKNLYDAGIVKQRFVDSMTTLFVMTDKSVANLMSEMETRQADLQMMGEQLTQSEGEFLNVIRDGKIFFLNVKQAIDGYSKIGDEQIVSDFKKLISSNSSILDAFGSFGVKLNNPKISTEVDVYNTAMKSAIAISDTVFGLTRREFAASKNFDDRAAAMEKVTAQVLGNANVRLIAVKSTFTLVFIIVVAAAALLFIILAFSIIVSITGSIKNLLTDMERLGKGDLSFTVTVNGNDELSQIATKLGETVVSLAEMIGRLKKSADLLGGSTDSVNSSTLSLSSTAQRLGSQSDAVFESTGKVADNVNLISDSAASMSTSVNSVAAAIEEMSASLSEVAQNCQNESKITAQADTQARAANQLVGQLGSAAKQIEQVVDMISTIAEQTNLLALNATIEAARAGAAGKGFAVVAAEVKDLSRQTGDATQKISSEIKQIQGIINKTIDAITGIGSIITQVNTSSQNIVLAVEQQSTTINEIAGSMASANKSATDIASMVADSAKRLTEVTGGIQNVNSSVQESVSATATIGENVQTLTRLGSDLQDVVKRFTI